MMVWAPWQRLSLRDRLMVGILVPVVLFIAVNTALLYRQALRAADVAYDRTLLATAKSIGDQLEAKIENGQAQVSATPLYSALEPFEADNRSRLYYRVNGFRGEMVSGFEGLKPWHGSLPAKGPYAALVDFYDDDYLGTPVRVAVLLQPVVWEQGQGMASVQVAETLELRQTLAKSLLIDTLWRQAALIALIAAVVVWVVHRATLPVRTISQQMRARAEGDLTPIFLDGTAPKEIVPLVSATNHLMERLRDLLETQKRFVRDTSHQLRTPLAVLKAQVQSARRGDLAPELALQEISETVDRATTLANQMLALAKVEQLKQQGEPPVFNWADIVRDVSLDLSPLIAQKALDFEWLGTEVFVRSHEWALRELARNLLHNAIMHCPAQGPLNVRLTQQAGQACLTIADSGPGLSPAQRSRLFQPFVTSSSRSGSGLGLAICHDIVLSLGGRIELNNRLQGETVLGLDAIVKLPLATNLADHEAV